MFTDYVYIAYFVMFKPLKGAHSRDTFFRQPSFLSCLVDWKFSSLLCIHIFLTYCFLYTSYFTGQFKRNLYFTPSELVAIKSFE
jgi:hypothetical protein